jgi:hypothetical protein
MTLILPSSLEVMSAVVMLHGRHSLRPYGIVCSGLRILGPDRLALLGAGALRGWAATGANGNYRQSEYGNLETQHCISSRQSTETAELLFEKVWDARNIRLVLA